MLQSALYRVGYTAITFIATILLANVLEPNYFGKLSLLIVNASIISLVTGFGADGIVLNFLVNKKWNSKQGLTFIWIVLCVQILLFFLIQAVHFGFTNTTVLSQVSIKYMGWELLYLIGIVITEKYLTLYYSFQRAQLYNVILLGISLLYLAVIIFYKQYGNLDYIFTLKILALIHLCQLVFILIFFHLLVKPIEFEFIRWHELKETFTKSFVIMITNIIQLLAYRVDFWIINFYYTEYQVGIYSQANKLANLIWIMPNILAMLVFPKFSHLSKEELPSFFRMATILNILFTLITLLAAPYFYQFFLSKDYLVGLNSFFLMLPGYFCWALVIYFGAYFSWLGRFHYNLYASGICLLLITVFDLILIPTYSINGAALSNTVVYSTVLFFYIFLFIKESGLSIKSFWSFHKRDVLLFKKYLNEM